MRTVDIFAMVPFVSFCWKNKLDMNMVLELSFIETTAQISK